MGVGMGEVCCRYRGLWMWALCRVVLMLRVFLNFLSGSDYGR